MEIAVTEHSIKEFDARDRSQPFVLEPDNHTGSPATIICDNGDTMETRTGILKRVGKKRFNKWALHKK